MSKYIIEIPDDVQYVLLNGQTDNKCYTAVRPVAELEELNSDYINEHYGKLQDEAYQRGHDDGYEAGCATAFKPVSDAEYQRGLEEAMNAFKKLYSCGWERDWKAMGFEFDDGEWSTSFEYIIGQYTAAEIVEKVKAYEDKQKEKDRFEVGDIVRSNEFKDIAVCVTYVDEGWNQFSGIVITDTHICRRGHTYASRSKDEWHKTGEHFDIEQLWKGES